MRHLTVNEFLAERALAEGNIADWKYWTYEAIDPVKERREREAQEIQEERYARGIDQRPESKTFHR